MLCPTCCEPLYEEGICYDCDWFFKKEALPKTDLLCQQCYQPLSKNETCCECGCFFEKPEFIVTDLYNYNARPQRSYHRLDHFKEVLGQFQGREGKHIPPEILHKIKHELSAFSEATAIDVKKAMRKLKLTKYMENFYYILFAVTGKQPPYIKREIEDKIVRMFKRIDCVWRAVEKDKRRSFLNYYYILFKLLELMEQTELPPQVPLLRTRLRLRQRDFIWKKVCDELGWTWKQTDIAYANQSVKPRQGAYKRKPNAETQL